METKKTPLPNIYLSLLPLLILIVSIISGMLLIDSSPHIPMLLTTMITILIAMFVLGMKWTDLEEAFKSTINSSMPAILILMTVGVAIGTWMLSGVVPTMIYYGLQIINPKLFFALRADCLLNRVHFSWKLLEHGGHSRHCLRRDRDQHGV